MSSSSFLVVGTPGKGHHSTSLSLQETHGSSEPRSGLQSSVLGDCTPMWFVPETGTRTAIGKLIDICT